MLVTMFHSSGRYTKKEYSKVRGESNMSKYECLVCGYIYDEAEGDDVGGIAPGTIWEDLPEDWLCPVCGVGKDQFEKLEES